MTALELAVVSAWNTWFRLEVTTGGTPLGPVDFMDGNLNREEMVKDLESMKEVGIGNLVVLEVNIGVPRGPVQVDVGGVWGAWAGEDCRESRERKRCRVI